MGCPFLLDEGVTHEGKALASATPRNPRGSRPVRNLGILRPRTLVPRFGGDERWPQVGSNRSRKSRKQSKVRGLEAGPRGHPPHRERGGRPSGRHRPSSGRGRSTSPRSASRSSGRASRSAQARARSAEEAGPRRVSDDCRKLRTGWDSSAKKSPARPLGRAPRRQRVWGCEGRVEIMATGTVKWFNDAEGFRDSSRRTVGAKTFSATSLPSRRWASAR